MLSHNFILFSRKQKKSLLHTAWKCHWKGCCCCSLMSFNSDNFIYCMKRPLKRLLYHDAHIWIPVETRLTWFEGHFTSISPPWPFQCISLLILRGWNFFHFPRIKLPNRHRTLFFIFVGYFHNWVGSKVLQWFLRVLRMFSSFYSFFSPGPVFFSFSSNYSNSIILNLLNQHHHANKPKTLIQLQPRISCSLILDYTNSKLQSDSLPAFVIALILTSILTDTHIKWLIVFVLVASRISELAITERSCMEISSPDRNQLLSHQPQH